MIELFHLIVAHNQSLHIFCYILNNAQASGAKHKKLLLTFSIAHEAAFQNAAQLAFLRERFVCFIQPDVVQEVAQLSVGNSNL